MLVLVSENDLQFKDRSLIILLQSMLNSEVLSPCWSPQHPNTAQVTQEQQPERYILMKLNCLVPALLLSP